MDALIIGIPAWAFAIFMAVLILAIVWAIVFKPERGKAKGREALKWAIPSPSGLTGR